MESITAYHNPDSKIYDDFVTVYLPASVFYFVNINRLKINGSKAYPSNLSQNYGSVFEILNSNILLEGVILFYNNTADNGPAFRLLENSLVYLKDGLWANFINNKAKSLGGAIYATDIVSYGTYIAICYNKLSYALYPGELLQIPISVNDSNHHHTFSILTISVAERQDNHLKDIDWFFNGKQVTYTTIIERTTNCTNINLTIHTAHLSERNRRGLLLFSISNPSTIVGIRVALNNCPPGFQLNSAMGACDCLQNFKKIVNHYSNEKELQCNINDLNFTRPYKNLWAGLDKNGSLHYSLNCPHGYCSIHSHHDKLTFNDTGSFVASSSTKDSEPLCHGSRTGELCGKCISNYSVVFGSTICLMCTNKLWLVSSIIYIITGPLIVFLLYTLNLTLSTGTLNSIIFFAQVANAMVAGYLKIPCSDCGSVSYYFIRFSSAFISWLNLNLGFPLCLYNGMTEMHKAVSNRLSKSSVQVLVTVVHLSFTQLLQAILNFGIMMEQQHMLAQSING
uniref:Uncharacterized protein n=1 Tax=Amphimedon queenslandica TaxID=400682 RepID=A0A1X7U4H5_AMPQE